MSLQLDSHNQEPIPSVSPLRERQQRLFAQAAELYDSDDSRGTILRVWSRLESAWKANLTDPEIIQSPSELMLHGREWVHIPAEFENDPQLLAQIFPGINPQDLSPQRFRNVINQSGYNWRRLIQGPLSEIPMLKLSGIVSSSQPEYEASTTLAMFVMANEGSLILRGKPFLDDPSQFAHLTGSTLENRYVDAQYDPTTRRYNFLPSPYLTYEYPEDTEVLYALPDELPKSSI